MLGVFNYARFFSFISLMILFTFIIPSVAMQANNNIRQSEGLDRLGVDNSVAFPANQPVKKRNAAFVKVSAGNSIKAIMDENTSSIRSVSAPKVFSYDVVQQPESKPFYVSSSKNLVTEFGLARKYGTIGLVAHNNLAGSLFKDLLLGDEIRIVYKDGHTARYTVSAIYRFRALEPTNIESRFVDLDSKKI